MYLSVPVLNFIHDVVIIYNSFKRATSTKVVSTTKAITTKNIITAITNMARKARKDISTARKATTRRDTSIR